MLMKFNNQTVEPYEVWYLKDIEQFTYRSLLLGKVQDSKTKKFKDIATLIEVRKADNMPFVNNLSGTQAARVARIEKKRIDFTLSDLRNSRKSKSWIFGVNVEIRNKSKDVTQIRQYAADWHNKKKLVKKIYLENASR